MIYLNLFPEKSSGIFYNFQSELTSQLQRHVLLNILKTRCLRIFIIFDFYLAAILLTILSTKCKHFREPKGNKAII